MKEFENFIRHLRWEAFSLAVLMVVLVQLSSVSLWTIPITFLLFDVGMVGYLKDDKTGALFYNLSHNLTLPTLFIAYGLFQEIEVVAVIGFLWTFHIAVDRTLGFGLKEQTSFQHTHLGKLKKKR
ncbi:DUF4260 domain-containing protein [Candidatus Saccharibacteria bacterium]|nr:DUF4260 domain-containing protein [Candidatus Saccharibacteria bacterium]MCA9328429.1 DUF4260 domain-containing protein [Candidatus Saccharibacteria bacterium]